MSATTILTVGALTLDPVTRKVRHGISREIPLAPIQGRILHAMMKSPDVVFRYERLCMVAWGDEWPAGGESAIKTHLSQLRGRLETIGARHVLGLSWGDGAVLRRMPDVVTRSFTREQWSTLVALADRANRPDLLVSPR